MPTMTTDEDRDRLARALLRLLARALPDGAGSASRMSAPSRPSCVRWAWGGKAFVRMLASRASRSGLPGRHLPCSLFGVARITVVGSHEASDWRSNSNIARAISAPVGLHFGEVVQPLNDDLVPGVEHVEPVVLGRNGVRVRASDHENASLSVITSAIRNALPRHACSSRGIR
jgi:hypothetical protein